MASRRDFLAGAAIGVPAFVSIKPAQEIEPQEAQPQWVHVFYLDLQPASPDPQANRPIAHRKLGPFTMKEAFATMDAIARFGLRLGHVLIPPSQILRLELGVLA